MGNYLSILRGINVSGQKQIKMNDLKNCYEELGFKNVQTYIQSGNVIFQSSSKDRKKLTNEIKEKIFEVYKFNVPVLILDNRKLESVISNNPFDINKIDSSKLYLTFLFTQPDNKLIREISEIDPGTEQYKIEGDVIYFYCPDGYGRTKFNNNFFEKKLKVEATTRNWKTSTKLLNMLQNMH